MAPEGTDRGHRQVSRQALGLLEELAEVAGRLRGEAARSAGVETVAQFAEVAAAAAAVKKLVQPGDLVLLKASRAVGLERVGEALRSRG